jgi:hypothetical protein
MKRGDVVMVDFPFTDTGEAKVRPGVVIQNDRDNRKLRKTVVAMITGNLQRWGDPSHVYIDPHHPDGAASGLKYPSPEPGGDEAAAVARLKKAINRLQAHSGEMHDSPFFGHLTPEQWRELHLIHCNHHLALLHPKTA